MMGNQSPFFLEVRIVGETINPAQHCHKQGTGFLEPFNGVNFIFSLGKFRWFGHPRLQHLVKTIPGLGSFNKISFKELHKRFESINFHKGLRTSSNNPVLVLKEWSFGLAWSIVHLDASL